jgi:hypothetical protein
MRKWEHCGNGKLLKWNNRWWDNIMELKYHCQIIVVMWHWWIFINSYIDQSLLLCICNHFLPQSGINNRFHKILGTYPQKINNFKLKKRIIDVTSNHEIINVTTIVIELMLLFKHPLFHCTCILTINYPFLHQPNHQTIEVGWLSGT